MTIGQTYTLPRTY